VTPEDARGVLHRLGVRHACDLDLLIFFARHPRTLLTSESLAGFLGYDLKDIAESLDVLMTARLLTRAQTPAHAARMYVFAVDDTSGDWLPSLLAVVSTRAGRLAVREGLARGQREPGNNGSGSRPDAVGRPGPRRVVEQAKRHTGTA
jgi:hypothetical protein